jgi:hypothetical protein
MTHLRTGHSSGKAKYLPVQHFSVPFHLVSHHPHLQNGTGFLLISAIIPQVPGICKKMRRTSMKSDVQVIFKRLHNSLFDPWRREISSGIEIVSQYRIRDDRPCSKICDEEAGRGEGWRRGRESRGERGGGTPTKWFTLASAVWGSLRPRTALSTGVGLPSDGPYSNSHQSCAKRGGCDCTSGWLRRRCRHAMH